VLVFIGRRLVWAVLLMGVITFVTFVIFVVIPAPSNAGLQRQLEPDLKVQLHLDGRSLPGQYAHFVDRVVLHGDLGYSLRQRDSVRNLLGAALPITASLVIGGVLVWLLLALPIGILSALRPRSLIDKGLMVVVLIGISAHPVWLGLVLSYLLGFKLHVFPVAGYCDLTVHRETGSCGGPTYWAYHLVLPWITFGLLYAALYARMIRASVLETLGEDYIRTARAKGAGTWLVLRRHALPNALLPVVSMLGMDMGLAFGGAIFVESVYGLPGVGLMLYRALTRSDRPVIMGIVLLVSVFVVIANLLVDIAYAVLDPRIRLQGKGHTAALRSRRRQVRAQPRVTESPT
jgi:peptide/nickel transport system permease protein